MIKSSRGGGGGGAALLSDSEFQLYRNTVPTLSELRGVLEHPEHPLWIRHWVWVKLFPLKNLYACTYNLLDRRFLDSPLRAEIVKCTHITSV